ncbi:hypothetical protein AOCH_000449 [Aspergillus ochraceoroseus]|uniref:Alpha/beta hydrolase fold-3 domain-containing protein n=1 Tax=Aspergillus ochraceoroseus TaxID=138278 RepID=A0A0F8V2L4_9EURO|nr:hypothetical protein AOCH_000449 [Aspergillus ochraceoroseus]
MAPLMNDPNTWSEWSEPDLLIRFEQMLKQKVASKYFKENTVAAMPITRKRWAGQYKEDSDAYFERVKGEISCQEILIPFRDGYQARALVYKPLEIPVDGCAVVAIIHGGGFCLGSAEMEAIPCIDATRSYGCISISLEYRLAPEYKYPTPFEDCWDAIRWIASNAGTLGGNLSKGFILGGTSAGAHMTATLSHWARDQNLSPPLTGLYLNVVGLVVPEAVPETYKDLYRSREQNKEGMTLSAAANAVYLEALQPDLTSHIYNPFNWPSGHAGLPPTYFQICGGDILRDEALIYERILREEHNTPTKVDIYPGLPHVFWVNFPTHSSTRKFYSDVNQGLGWLLKESAK